MSFKTDNFHKIKNAINLADKFCDFKVDFDNNRMLAYTKSIDKESAIIKALNSVNAKFTKEHTTAIKKFNINL